MRLKLLLFSFSIILSISINAQTNAKGQKPLKFDINKTISNIEKISNQNYEVLFKANIIEKAEDNFYIIKDESGKMKVELSDEQISQIGDYSASDIFYFTVKVKNFREQTFYAINIKKAE